MNSRKHFFAAIGILLGFGLVCVCWTSSGVAREVSTEYEIAVPAMKSDTQRMVEAYERLSDQYLSLVQNQLTGMAACDRDVTARLDRIERKLDTLSIKLELLQQAVAPQPAPAAPVEKPAAKEPAKP